MTADHVSIEVVVPAGGRWLACLEVAPTIEATVVVPRYRCGQPVERAKPSERLAQWRQRVPHVKTDHEGLQLVIARSAEDLGALRIFDPDYPERMVVAAGAPWFMTVFGRDSLLTAWSALLVDPDLALGVLQTLARFQGNEVDPRNEEEPGRILHEMRFGEAASLSLGGGSIYYGTADATPLFVMLLGELRRWGLATEVVDQLLPNADRALDGSPSSATRRRRLRRVPAAPRTGASPTRAGRTAGTASATRTARWPRRRSPCARSRPTPTAPTWPAPTSPFEAGDEAIYERYRGRAADLKADFNRDFWLEDEGWFAVGLDADKQADRLADVQHRPLPVDRASSTRTRPARWPGTCSSPTMFNGWGVRTLGPSMGGYNPVSYHCGSVWPHDTAIVAAGLTRYGFEEGAQRLVMSLIDAGQAQGGRLPELFSGLDRSELPMPVGYPTSCSPQAWAAASPLLCLRTLLRFDPWVPYGKTWLAPMVPPGSGGCRVEGIPLAGSAWSTVEIVGDEVSVEGLPDDASSCIATFRATR